MANATDRPFRDPITDGDLPTRMLVLGLARHDGTILASDAFPVADACGRSPEQLRSCLRRLVSEGLFTRHGVGQNAVYRATDTGLAVLGAVTARAHLAHVQDVRGGGWDGRWHLVAFAIPEARRWARDELRDQLGRLGGAAVHNGLYVSPHPWEKDVIVAAEGVAASDHVTLASTDDLAVGGVSDPPAALFGFIPPVGCWGEPTPPVAELDGLLVGPPVPALGAPLLVDPAPLVPERLAPPLGPPPEPPPPPPPD